MCMSFQAIPAGQRATLWESLLCIRLDTWYQGVHVETVVLASEKVQKSGTFFIQGPATTNQLLRDFFFTISNTFI